MNILLVENGYEPMDELNDIYNNFTDADVDVYNLGDLDFESMKDKYDMVLSELELADGVIGPNVLDRFNADKKAIYTVWAPEEARDKPVIYEALESYDFISKPGPVDLMELFDTEL